MVAKITTPFSISRVLNYNEQKVQKGKAACLHAGNFLKQVNEMNFYQKLERFQRFIEKNTSKTNTLHISLNFHPGEKLSKEKLLAIAETYMKKIGFGEQPYLVYQHFDAAHPHLHIVTTNIQEDGKRINTHNIGKNESEVARKEIERSFGLLVADKEKNIRTDANKLHLTKVNYGSAETRSSITNIVSYAVNRYKFTSLAELNAVLKLFNVAADPGSSESRMYKYHGLNYHFLDEKGNKTGVPVKASSIYFKPSLALLEKKFFQNASLRLPFKSKLSTSIDWAFYKKPTSIAEFINELKKERITVVTRENEQGLLYGITFIDHRTKTVFNGSDLGKQYTAAGIKQRISAVPGGEKKSAQKMPEKSKHHLLGLLLNKERNDFNTPFELKKKKKKSRKPKL